MLVFLKTNIWTIAVLLVLTAFVVIVIKKLVSDRKKGVSHCGCDCSTCGGCCAYAQNNDN